MPFLWMEVYGGGRGGMVGRSALGETQACTQYVLPNVPLVSLRKQETANTIIRFHANL